MPGVIVIANKATAVRDIFSGTTHKFTLWLDDVRQNLAKAAPQINYGR